MSGHREVARLKSRLDATFARMPGASADIELQADFAKYLCVLVSGFFENAVVALVLDFTQKRSAGEVALYVERSLDRWTNPNVEKLSNLLGAFDPAWRVKAEGYLIDERKAAVNSLVALRHKIAHGESVNTTPAQVKQYYGAILKVVEFVELLTTSP